MATIAETLAESGDVERAEEAAARAEELALSLANDGIHEAVILASVAGSLLAMGKAEGLETLTQIRAHRILSDLLARQYWHYAVLPMTQLTPTVIEKIAGAVTYAADTGT